MSFYDKTRRVRRRVDALLSPLNPDGSFRSKEPNEESSSSSSGRKGPAGMSSPSRKVKDRAEPAYISFPARSEDDWAEELTSTLERVMKVTADYRKQGFKSKKGVNAPIRRSELENVEDRRMWLLYQCHDLVKKERDKVVSSRRKIVETRSGADGSSTPELGSDPLFDVEEFGATTTNNRTPDRPRTPADPQAMFRILIRAHFTSLEKELFDVYPALGESSLSGEVSDKPRRADNRSPTRPIELPSDTRRRNELRSDLGISPPSGHSVKIERLKRYDDETRTERFKKSLDSRGRESIARGVLSFSLID
jgi:hypothetical protein